MGGGCIHGRRSRPTRACLRFIPKKSDRVTWIPRRHEPPLDNRSKRAKLGGQRVYLKNSANPNIESSSLLLDDLRDEWRSVSIVWPHSSGAVDHVASFVGCWPWAVHRDKYRAREIYVVEGMFAIRLLPCTRGTYVSGQCLRNLFWHASGTKWVSFPRGQSSKQRAIKLLQASSEWKLMSWFRSALWSSTGECR